MNDKDYGQMKLNSDLKRLMQAIQIEWTFTTISRSQKYKNDWSHKLIQSNSNLMPKQKEIHYFWSDNIVENVGKVKIDAELMKLIQKIQLQFFI